MIYLIRNKKGALTLHQRRPGNSYLQWKPFGRKKITSPFPIFPRGQIFNINEVPGSEHIIYSEDNSTMVPGMLYITTEKERINNLWVTRGDDCRLMLHYKLKPTRMRDSEQWKYMYFGPHTSKKVRTIKKNGKKWTSWAGHCYINEFPGSYNISFDDTSPTPVEIRPYVLN